MARRRPLALSWFELALKAQQTLWASSQVIAHRTQRMASASTPPSRRDADEFARMWPEKVSAATSAGLRAMAAAKPADALLGTQLMSASLSAWSAWMSLASSRTPRQVIERQARLARTLVKAAEAGTHASARSTRVAAAALEPYRSASRNNAKRLAKAAARRR